MASRVETLRLVPGGLNLLAPPDQIPEDDCIQLDGWWPGAAGKLEQTYGFATKFTLASLTNVDSLLQVGGKLYCGGAGNLFQSGRGGNAAIDTGYDSTPLGLTASQNYAWIMNQARQRKDDGANTTLWTTETPGSTAPNYYVGTAPTATVSAAASALVAGDYDVYVTFENADGHEGNPTPVTTVTLTAGDKITVTRPTRNETTVFGWNVYIKGPNMAQPYQISQNVIVYATASFDYVGTAAALQDDDSVISFDAPLAEDHDPAPAAMVAADDLFNNRIVVANSAAHTNRIWYTNAGEPSYFPGSGGDPGGNWLDVGQDDGDPVLAIIVRPGRILIYRRRSIWHQLGDFDDTNAKLEPVVPEMGILGVRAAVGSALGDFFASEEGAYRLADWPVKQSEKLTPIFLGQDKDFYQGMAAAYRNTTALGFSNGRVCMSYAAGGGTYPNTTFVLHADTGRWFAKLGGFGCFLNAGNNTAEFTAGAAAGRVLTLDSGRTEPPGLTILNYRSGFLDCGRPDHEKNYPDIVISHNTQGATLTLQAIRNKGAETITIGTLNSTTLTRQVIALVYPAGHANAGEPIRAFNLSISLSGTGATGGLPVTIDGPMLLHWYDRPRQAKVFDSGETDHGAPGYKTIDFAELDIDAPGGFWELQGWSDDGSGLVQIKQRRPIAVTAGRNKIVVPLELGGRLFRYVVAAAQGKTPGPTDTFELYGLNVRVLPIGVYVDGAMSDYWQETPQSIGV